MGQHHPGGRSRKVMNQESSGCRMGIETGKASLTVGRSWRAVTEGEATWLLGVRWQSPLRSGGLGGLTKVGHQVVISGLCRPLAR